MFKFVQIGCCFPGRKDGGERAMYAAPGPWGAAHVDKGLGAAAPTRYSEVILTPGKVRSLAAVYRSAVPASAPELIVALRKLIDAVIDGSATREPSAALDTV